MQSHPGIKSKAFTYLTVAIAMGILLLYTVVDPAESRYMPKCMFHLITGYDCPGCGMQRMIHALLHGNPAAAWEANAFLLCSAPFLAFMLFVDLRRKSMPRLYRLLNSPAAISLYVAAIICWGIFRNI